MNTDRRLSLVLHELVSLRSYINTLKKDGTINIYTANVINDKIDRCDEIATTNNIDLISKNR